MRLAFDARARERPHSSFARVLLLLEESARTVGLPFTEWTAGACEAEVLWTPRLDPPPARGPQLVVTLHDVNPLLPDGRSWFFHFRREVRFRRRVHRALKAAWRVATDSEDSRARIQEAFGGERERLRVVPLYAERSLGPGAADVAVLGRLGLKPGYVLCVGALRRHKNWEGLLHAYARLPGPLRQRHPLVLAGDPRRAGRRLAGLAGRLMIEAELRPLGVVAAEVLPHLYRGAAVFAFPSLMEGFGLPPLEAMASGVPVVASDRTCLPEVLGAAALFCDPTNAQALAEALERVLGHPELADRLREAGLKQAASYGPERTGAAMRRLLGLV